MAESKPPYSVFFAICHDWDIYEGRIRYRDWLRQYKECEQSGVWPGVATDIVQTSMPEYIYTDGSAA